MLWTIPTISALLATPGAAVATAPPAFATEFSLSYVVTNHAYGFMTVGVWRVDHKDSTGTLNLREREDTHNTTLHPQSQVKDYKHYLMTNFDPGLPAPTHACTSEIAAGVTQPRWVVAPNATNIAPPSVGHQRWREYHASQGICVDFYVNGSSAPRPTAHSSSSEGSAPMLPTTINARMNILPYLIEYYAGCTSGFRPNPSQEKLAQTNVYTDFVFADNPPSIFATPPASKPCNATAAAAAAGLATASRNVLDQERGPAFNLYGKVRDDGRLDGL